MNRPLSITLFTLLVFGLFGNFAWARHAHHDAASAGQHAAPVDTLSLAGAEATVAFSPNGDATDVVVKAIKGATRQVLVQAYGFTSAPIIKALGDAKDRGVDVEAILDKTNESKRYSGATYLSNHNIPVWIDDSVAIAHNKVMIIDRDSVITGSFNFTKAAQSKNAENVLLIAHAPALARDYYRDWMWRKSLSHGYR
jgi:phosphatidylserine/phosphatidylglycerophosphate/cardiolipin synthase-like enzyme